MFSLLVAPSMDCVEKLDPVSEREEGELSDISSDEEKLLRERLHVLETYNQALGRKKAKQTLTPACKQEEQNKLKDLSDISSSESEDYELLKSKKSKTINYKHKKRKRDNTSHHIAPKPKETKQLKKMAVISESSDESDQEYKNKRRKLEDAVHIKNYKTDTSLKARLLNMLGIKKKDSPKKLKKQTIFIYDQQPKINYEPVVKHDVINMHEFQLDDKIVEKDKEVDNCGGHVIDLSKDIESSEKNSDVEVVEIEAQTKDAKTEEGSDDDLEMLRQHALISKSKAVKTVEETKPPETCEITLEDEDSDTAELRLICLKSALLKKAMEMKKKQKIKKRFSHSTSLYDDIIAAEQMDLENDDGNNTDTESVDMDIGSDDDKDKPEIVENSNECEQIKEVLTAQQQESNELDEDEDLLRAQLLTSLSKKLPLIANPKSILENIEEIKNNQKADLQAQAEDNNTPLEKRFIINTADSDSDEHEATKSLTKTHMTLYDNDFQAKLDVFLKSTWMKVEKNKLLVGVQEPAESAVATPKFVPKAVKHLPKSEQMEYKNLVKRMTELERVKQARQLNFERAIQPAKDTLKPRNVSLVENNLEEQIAMSRKKIAEESAKVLQLKEQAKNLSQKYEIVATELRNLATAVTLNKREQKIAQIKLSKIRAQHQTLVKRSTTVRNTFHRRQTTNFVRQQKENAPITREHINTVKTLKVSVVNDLNEKVDDASNKVANDANVISEPKESLMSRLGDKIENGVDTVQSESDAVSRVKVDVTDDKRSVQICSQNGSREGEEVVENAPDNDYQSPLQFMASSKERWDADPNGVLCPYEVAGSCKDQKCKYIHTKNT